jgi:ribosomal protein L40E
MTPAVQPDSGTGISTKIVCPHCMALVPARLSRCPRCRKNLHPLRLVKLALGVVGLLALLVILFSVLRTPRVWEVETYQTPTRKESRRRVYKVPVLSEHPQR